MRRYSIFPALISAFAVAYANDAYADRTLQIANIDATSPVVVQIQTECKGENPVFRLVNTGPDWPKLANVRISRTEDSALLFDRSMRMKNGQKASIRLPVKRVGDGEFSITVLPTWSERSAQPDATISCN